MKFNQVYTRIPRTTHEYESISKNRSQNPVQCTQYVQNVICTECMYRLYFEMMYFAKKNRSARRRKRASPPPLSPLLSHKTDTSRSYLARPWLAGWRNGVALSPACRPAAAPAIGVSEERLTRVDGDGAAGIMSRSFLPSNYFCFSRRAGQRQN